MHGIPTIYDPRSNGNYCCYTLKTHSFQGYTFGPGKCVPVIFDAKKGTVCSLCDARTTQREGVV